ncbi:MAG: TIGR02147 family protein [Bdellovibrionales bacterium]|nr:TIGR02147 family protein [Bdellovibrionales bacterium]
MEITPKEVSAPSSEGRPNVPVAPRLNAFTDYRVFLKEFYDYKREITKGELRPYGYGTFSAAANIRSPNYLKLIIEGQRNLSIDMAKKFARGLGMGKEETEEFLALVEYTQAIEPLERNRCLKVLSDLRVRQQLKSGEINAETWEKVPGWVTWVLYALTDQAGVKFEPDRLFEMMRGKARPDEIRRSLERLLASGELTKDPLTGEIGKGRELMSGSESVPVALVRKLQAELIYLGLESLFQDQPQDREIGAQTMALTEDEFEVLKFELRQFRKRWAKDVGVARKAIKGNRVFQLNIQLFPVTTESKGEN